VNLASLLEAPEALPPESLNHEIGQATGEQFLSASGIPATFCKFPFSSKMLNAPGHNYEVEIGDLRQASCPVQKMTKARAPKGVL
jgi:hypothetical protein